MNTFTTQTASFGMRNKYFQSQYGIVLRNVLVAEKICTVDNSDAKTIQNPYGSQPTATIQAVAGTYSVSAWTVTDDYLTVSDEVIYAEQVFGHDQFFAVFDIMASRLDNMMYAVAKGIDQYVLNDLCNSAGVTLSTNTDLGLTGGFTVGGNINTIMGKLLSLVAGYQDVNSPKGTFLVIENTDLVGFTVAGATSGFRVADSVLQNGYMNEWMGTSIYVVRSGTFQSTTMGTKTFTNSGHRVFGVTGSSTYASPRGLQYEEKGVSGKTGKEVVVYGLIGHKLWTVKANLVVDIDVTV